MINIHDIQWIFIKFILNLVLTILCFFSKGQNVKKDKITSIKFRDVRTL